MNVIPNSADERQVHGDLTCPGCRSRALRSGNSDSHGPGKEIPGGIAAMEKFSDFDDSLNRSPAASCPRPTRRPRPHAVPRVVNAIRT